MSVRFIDARNHAKRKTPYGCLSGKIFQHSIFLTFLDPPSHLRGFICSMHVLQESHTKVCVFIRSHTWDVMIACSVTTDVSNSTIAEKGINRIYHHMNDRWVSWFTSESFNVCTGYLV